jgi:hypothetical protein
MWRWGKADRILIWKFEKKRLLARPRSKWEGILKWVLSNGGEE